MLSTVLLGVITFVLALLLYAAEKWPTPWFYWAISKLPGPPGIFFFGNSLELSKLPPSEILDWTMKQLSKQKRFMRVWIIGACSVFIFKPDDVQVLLSSTNHLKKGLEYEPVSLWLNEGLLTSSGQKWHTRRKMLTNPFHFKILEYSMAGLNKHCRLLVAKIKETAGKTICAEDFLTLCTLDVICETAMGIELNSQNNASQDYVKNIKRFAHLIVRRLTKPWLFKPWIFRITPTGREFFSKIKYLQQFTTNVIMSRKKNFSLLEEEQNTRKKTRRAFLDTLLEMEIKNPGCLSIEDIREEVDTFTFEGHDTTSAALNFYFFNMGINQKIQERVYEELTELFADDIDRDITTEDLKKMVYLEKTIKESLRVNPSVPYISRLLEKDLVLSDGVLIPTGTNVIVMPYKVHRLEEHWPDPELFDPDRFCEDQVHLRHPFAYIPFSAGPRNCIGQRFAMMELKMVAATVLRKFRIEPVTKKEELTTNVFLVLRPNAPILSKFILR